MDFIIISLLYYVGFISISTISILYISNKLTNIIYEKIENSLKSITNLSFFN